MKIRFDNKDYECRDDETVLQSFLRHGVSVPFSCRNGVCHACLLRSKDTKSPERAQKGIKKQLADKGYFMSCMCRPEADMDIELPRPADIMTRAVVYEKELISPDVCRLLIEPATQLYYRAGQFINLRREDSLTRSYSIASVPHDDYYIELHIKHQPEGQMSEWIFSELKAGDEIEFSGPMGDCYYLPDDKDEDLLLISTSTGVGPHFGIARDALLSGHRGKVVIYHGARKHHGHYLFTQLEELTRKYPNFSYVLCASDDVRSNFAEVGRANEIALLRTTEIKDWRIYLSGNPDMVNMTIEDVIALGVNEDRIHSDPFEYDRVASNTYDTDKKSVRQQETPDMTLPTDEAAIKRSADTSNNRYETEADELEGRKFPDPDPEMWRALQEGTLMFDILDDFYNRVFEDELLAPYFTGVTRQRLVEKVFNFHYQMFTGEKVYFGDRPKNSHHWMVISDELFDYRESIMEACLRDHGLPDHLVKRWLDYEELYRADIVKSRPAQKVLFGEKMPLDGFEEMNIDASTLCDSCQGEINIGDLVRYHIRLGTTYCSKCMYAGH